MTKIKTVGLRKCEIIINGHIGSTYKVIASYRQLLRLFSSIFSIGTPFEKKLMK